MILAFIFLLALVRNFTYCTKTWKSDIQMVEDQVSLKMDEILNWNSTKSPIAFESEMNTCELIIPMDTDPKSKIDVVPISSCKTATVSKRKKGRWFDPRNWDTGYHKNNAVPHLERLPCITDDVRIPTIYDKGSTVIVQDKPAISVKSLKIASKTYTSDSLKTALKNGDVADYIASETGTDLSTIISIQDPKCSTENTGCECGYTNYEFEICEYLKNDCNKKLQCSSPFKPTGHCCFICGEYLKVGYHPKDFNLGRFTSKVESYLRGASSTERLNLDYHVSKIQTGQVHIIIINDEGYTGKINSIAEALEKMILDTKDLGIISSNLISAGVPINPDTWFTPFRLIWVTLLGNVIIVSSLFLFHFQFRPDDDDDDDTYYTHDTKQTHLIRIDLKTAAPNDLMSLFRKSQPPVRYENKSEELYFEKNNEENNRSSINESSEENGTDSKGTRDLLRENIIDNEPTVSTMVEF